MGFGKAGYLRLPLGEDCLIRARTQLKKVAENLDAMESVAKDTSMA